MQVEFVKMVGLYHVEIDGNYRGRVKRVEDWTARGTRIRWESYSKNGVFKGSGSTRNEAAQYLFPTSQP